MAALIAVAVCASVAAPAAFAADAPSRSERFEDLAREGAARLLRTLEELIEAIPQYEAPIITDDGDIIIRRRRDSESQPPIPTPTQPDVDSTDT